MIRKTETIGNCTLILGDSLDALETVPPVSVLVMDPPYCSGGFQEAGKAVGSIGTRDAEAIALDDMSTRGYVAMIREVCRRVPAAAEGYIFTDWKMWGWTLEAAELGGFATRNMVVWDKGAPGMGSPWRNAHELIYYGKRKNRPARPGKSGNVLRVKRTKNENHPTEKPTGIIDAILNNAIEGAVVDPFMGSGTTGVSCVAAGRPFFGIEIDEGHFATACERIADAVARPRFEFEPMAEQVALFGAE